MLKHHPNQYDMPLSLRNPMFLAMQVLDREGFQHSLRVARNAEKLAAAQRWDFRDREDARKVALLHDVLEDSEYTEHDLYDLGYSKRVVRAVKALTRPEEGDYMSYIEAVNKSTPLVRLVKLSDLMDNMDRCRGEHGGEVNASLFKRYSKAMTYLLNNVPAKVAL